MRSPEGFPEFCPGCPVAGAFVGEVTAESIGVVERRQSDGESLQGALDWLDSPHGLQATDKDGCETTLLTPDKFPIHELSPETVEMLVRRVAQCAGVTNMVHGSSRGSYSHSDCRAWNQPILREIAEDQEERPQDS
jgi:hypothetical protein